MAMKITVVVFLHVTLCHMGARYQCFARTCCLHFEGRTVRKVGKKWYGFQHGMRTVDFLMTFSASDGRITHESERIWKKVGIILIFSKEQRKTTKTSLRIAGVLAKTEMETSQMDVQVITSR
jgi:hypothetical protein